MALLVYHRARARVLSAVAGAFCACRAFAADAPFFPAPEPAPVNQPVEFGSGWYLRGDVGYENTNAPVITTDFTRLIGRMENATGGIGVGFQYNDWFRTDLTLDRSVYRLQGPQGSIYCPYGTLVNVTVPDPFNPGKTRIIEGYRYDPAETCTPIVDGHINRTSLLANAYLDLGAWYGVTPYVGAGVGVSYLQTNSSVNYYENANGALWAPNLGVNGSTKTWWAACPTPQIPDGVCLVDVNSQFPFAQINPNSHQSRKTYKFAWNLMAGISYSISQNLKLDLHYRLLGIGDFTGLPGVLTGSGAATKYLLSQEVRLGFRLQSD